MERKRSIGTAGWSIFIICVGIINMIYYGILSWTSLGRWGFNFIICAIGIGLFMQKNWSRIASIILFGITFLFATISTILSIKNVRSIPFFWLLR